ncbi:MAG: sulfatase-like hydrolase/transferase [Candidatus Aminicenantales bacterium]
MTNRSGKTPSLVKSAIGPVVFFAMTLFLFGPFTIFWTNILEFANTSADLALAGLGLALLASLALLLVLTGLKAVGPAFLEKGVSLVFATGFLMWLQGNFLLWPYGPMDGRDIPWAAMKRFGYMDGAVWILVLIAALVLSSAVIKIAGKAALLLIVIQLISGAVLFFGQQEPPSFKNFYVDATDEFVFSKRANVILLVLDTFQTDAFDEIIRNSPEVAKPFQGFTYFRNSLGGYTFTELSVALMLTGRYYDNSLPFERWKKAAYESGSIPRVLKADGWQVDLFPKVSYSLYYSEDIASNFVRGRPAGERRFDVACVYDLSLFRCLPHFLKRKIYNNQDWTVRRLYVRQPSKLPKGKDAMVRWIRPLERRTLKNRELFSPQAYLWSQDVKFVDAMIAESRLSDVRGAFKFYHIGGPHIPLNLNENLGFERMTINRPNYIRFATASLKLTGLFLDHLRRLGIYDNSTIIIVGDHGAGYQGQQFVLQPGMPVEGDDSDIVTQSSRVAALPLILVKPPASPGDLKISDQPVSLADIPATVFSAIDLPARNSGPSMFDIDGSQPRERRFLFYSGRDIYSYYGDMSEFTVSGYGWQDRAWKRTGKVFTKDRVIELHPEKYVYGSAIALKSGGNALPYLEYGWGKALKENTWTEGRSSLLVLPVDPPSSDLILRVSLHPRPELLRPTNPNRDIIVTVNGNRLGAWTIETTAEHTYSMTIPRALVRDSLKIHFEVPGVNAVSDDDIDAERNKLGVAISRIVVRQ